MIIVIKNFPDGGDFSWYEEQLKRALGEDITIYQITIEQLGGV